MNFSIYEFLVNDGIVNVLSYLIGQLYSVKDQSIRNLIIFNNNDFLFY